MMPIRMLVALWLIVPTLLSAGEWPAFRGHVRSELRGRAEGTGYPTEWSPDKNIVWKQALPDAGNSSPVVSGGKVFLTCADNDGKQRHLLCFDALSGEELWKRTVNHLEPEPTHKTNPYCGSSPAADHERVVVWHGSAGVFCYDHEGGEIWSKEVGPIHHIWGYGSSPVIHEDMVFLNIGPGERTYLTGLSLKDGKTLWEAPEPGGSLGEAGPDGEKARWVGSWSTPQIARIGEREQVVCAMPTRVVSYEPSTGQVLWFCTGLENMPRGNLAYTDPLIGEEIGIMLGGFQGPAIGFRLGGEGDVTAANRLWRVTQRTPQRIGSGVIIDRLAYVPGAGPNVIQCLEIRTGEIRWEERIEGAAMWGSMILAGELIYVTDQAGTTHVIKPNPEKLEIVASNKLGERSNSTPAFVAGKIFLRTNQRLYCIAE
jgi:outer membrane protein assembly factor BamB